MTKKCPACNSTKYENINGDFRCARCGYVNKSTKNINKELEEKINSVQ